MTTIHLTTERLTLRRFNADDEDLLFALHSDPVVMRHLGPPATGESIRDERLPYYLGLYEKSEGFGYWAAIETATGAFLGWFLFRPPVGDPAPGTVELGYRLHTAAWGRGFATEGAQAVVEKGFAELGVERVVADTMAVNTRSRNVMEKVGLRFVRSFHGEWDEPLDGAEHGEVEYALSRAEWAATRGDDHGSAVVGGDRQATPAP